MKLDLPYGRTPYSLDLGERQAVILTPADLPAPPSPAALVDAALAQGAPGLRAGARVTVIVSDHTRVEPRAVFLEALRRHLPPARWTVAVATGTHGPAPLEALGIPEPLLRDAAVVNHDGNRDTDLVDLGVTRAGTPVVVHRCVVESDLVIATGCIRPHYFAGFGAGVKAIFPGLGAATAIRLNHRLKTSPGARAGVVDGNPCREDLEEAVARVPTPMFLLNGVCGPGDRIHAVVAGELGEAFRRGAALARPWFTVRAARSRLVIASDALPVTATLYQAAKIAAAAAPLVADHGTLAIVAECPDGVGPLDIVNEAIFRIGILPRLPPGARLVLVSGLPREVVARTLVEYTPNIASVLAGDRSMVTVMPRASQLICEASS